MSNQWDVLTKMVMQANPQDLVSWILEGAFYRGEQNVELQKKDPIHADLLYNIEWAGEDVILHIENQSRRDDEMARRVWEYNSLASIHSGLPVYSVVIYLVKQKKIVNPPYEMKMPTGLTVHRFFFQNIKLWEVSPEVLKQKNLSGLLPLLPLTKGGKRREVVEDMIESLQQAGKTDLLPLGYAFAALTFKKKSEQQWLEERFAGMEDIFEESWAYQKMVQKGAAKALKQGLEHVIIRFIETHFPDLVSLAKQKATNTKNAQQLQEMLDKLFVAHTEKEAEAILLGEQK